MGVIGMFAIPVMIYLFFLPLLIHSNLSEQTKTLKKILKALDR